MSTRYGLHCTVVAAVALVGLAFGANPVFAGNGGIIIALPYFWNCGYSWLPAPGSSPPFPPTSPTAMGTCDVYAACSNEGDNLGSKVSKDIYTTPPGIALDFWSTCSKAISTCQSTYQGNPCP